MTLTNSEDVADGLLLAYDAQLDGQGAAEPDLLESLGTDLEILSLLQDYRRETRTTRCDPLPSVIGSYPVIDRLGAGAFGVVYLARDTRLNRLVAIKMLHINRASHGETVERFEREGEALAKLLHPNIIAVHGIEENSGSPFLVEEYCSGGTLAQALTDKARRPRDAAALLEKLARGVEAAHRAGIIHRDLKPGNILLDENGEPKIADFGLAKWLEDENDNTKSGASIGTPMYMSPEQAVGNSKRVTAAADIYSLGVILYELLTGRPPFRADNILETLDQVKRVEPVPPRRLQPSVPKDLETICLKCLQKETHKRYASAEALADDLRCFLDCRPIQARPVGVREQLWRWCKREPKLASVGAIAIVLLMALLALGYERLARIANKPAASPDSQGNRNELNEWVEPQPGEERIFDVGNNVKMTFCWIPGSNGKFKIGSPKAEQEQFEIFFGDGRPIWMDGENEFEVAGVDGFWMAKYEMTQGQYVKLTGKKNPSVFCSESGRAEFRDRITDDFPVDSVSWDDAHACIEMMTVPAGVKRIALPSEVQWEWACRGGLGNGRVYYFGNTLNGYKANCDGGNPYGTTTKGSFLGRVDKK